MVPGTQLNLQVVEELQEHDPGWNEPSASWGASANRANGGGELSR